MPVYVVQTEGGKERHACELMSKALNPDVVTECFVPCSEVAKKFGGKWHRVERVMFPGYVFIDTTDVDEVERDLRSVPGFTRVLGIDGKCIPLDGDEVSWLNALTGKQDRTVRMSEGVIEGGKIVILSGPLVGHTGMISKIDRHKRLAYVEIAMLGRKSLVKLGLEIVRKSPEDAGARGLAGAQVGAQAVAKASMSAERAPERSIA